MSGHPGSGAGSENGDGAGRDPELSGCPGVRHGELPLPFPVEELALPPNSGCCLGNLIQLFPGI